MNKQRVTNGEPKHRVKLYKAGKMWLAMGITSAALGLATIATTSSVTVKADSAADAADTTTQSGEASAAVTDSAYALTTSTAQKNNVDSTQTNANTDASNTETNSGNAGSTNETNESSSAADASTNAPKTVTETPEVNSGETSSSDTSTAGSAATTPVATEPTSVTTNTETPTTVKQSTPVMPTSETTDANGAVTRIYVGDTSAPAATASTDAADTAAQQTTVTFTTQDGKTLSQTISGRIGDADFDTQVNAVIADLTAKGYTVNTNGYEAALHSSGYGSSLLGVTLEQAEKIITDKMAQSVSDYNAANPDHAVVTVAAGTTDQTAASVITDYAANGYTGNEPVLLYAYTQENYEQFMARTLLTPLAQDQDAQMALQVLSQYKIVPYWKLDGKITTADGYSITKVNSVMSLPTSKVPDAVTVFFTPDQQSYQVNYVDDTTGTTLPPVAIVGTTDELLNTDSATEKLSDYLANGYVLVSSTIPTTDTLTVVPSDYTGTDTAVALAGSKYEVHMTHGTTTYTADNPAPNTTADDMKVTDYEQVTFKYADKDRTTAFDTITVPVNETRTIVIDNVTGKVLSDTWSLADGQPGTLDAIEVPEVAGYTSNYPDGIPALDVETLVQGNQLGGITYSVVYKANNATLTVDTSGAGDKTPAGQSVTTTTGKNYTVILPPVAGYTASLETVGDAVADPKPGATIIAPSLTIDPITGSAVITGTGTASDQTLTVKYTADPQTLTVTYVDDSTKATLPDLTETLTGTTDATGTYTVKVPAGYQLSEGQPDKVDYTFTVDDSDDVTVHVTKIAVPDNGGTTTPSTGINGGTVVDPGNSNNDGTTTTPSTGANTTAPSTDGQNTVVTGGKDGQTTGSKTPTVNNGGETTTKSNGGQATSTNDGTATDHDGLTGATTANTTAATQGSTESLNSDANDSTAAPTAQSVQAATLPQTNDDNDAKTATAGLALLAMVGGLFGFGAKKRRQDNQ